MRSVNNKAEMKRKAQTKLQNRGGSNDSLLASTSELSKQCI